MSRKTRKLIWSAPLVAVFAVAGVLAAFALLGINPAQAHGLPGAVTNLTAKEDGTKAVDLSWTAPSTGATSYRIDVSADGQSWSAHATTTVNSYRDTKLAKSAGSVRYYRVFAINSAGTGPVSETVGPANVPLIGTPGSVTGLKVAVAADKKSITLTWNPPAKDGGAPIENYLVVYAMTEAELTDATAGAAPTSNTAVSNVGDVRDDTTTRGIAKTDDATASYTLKETMANEQWWFRVYAYNGAMISDTALETRTTGTIPLSNPDPPTGLTAVQVPGTSDVELYWYWPANNGGQAITGFQYRVRTGSGGWGDATATASPAINVSADATYDGNEDAPTADITNRFQVRTVAGTNDDEKMSSWSSEARLTIDDASIPTGTYTDETDCSTLATGTEAERTEKIRCEREVGLLKAQVDNPTGSHLETATVDELSATRDGKGNVDITISRHSPKEATSFRIDVANVRPSTATGAAASARWRPVVASTGNLGSGGEFVYEYQDETTGSQLQYRVFGKKGSIIVPANTAARYVAEKEVTPPTKVNNLTATGVSATQIDVSWTAPTSDGGATIDMYCVQVSANIADSDPFDALATVTVDNDTTAEDHCAAGTLGADNAADTFKLVDGMSYSHKKLNAASTRYFRVYAINNPVFGGDQMATDTDTIGATTKAADKPGMPEGLVAEQAKDSNYGGSANSGVYLLWNAPADPAGADIDGYRVERKVNNGSWTALESDTELTETIYHDTSEPAADEMRAYRVAARVGSSVGPWSDTAYYPAMMHDPTMPTAVMAAKVADMPTSQIKVSWSKPASGAVDGYIIERRYGDMMMDIPSDGYSGENGANRMHAFKNYKEWWETLNCKGMLAAAGSSETEVDNPAAGSDQAMYCAHFLNTAPTNITDSSKELSDAAKEKIKELFMKRYVSDADGNTMTMFTGMMHTDTGLEDGTEYTYRVRAFHGMKAGPWSAAAMATTDSAVTGLTAPTEVKATVSREGGDPGNPANVTVTWKDGQGASQHAVILFDSDFDFDPATDLKTGQTDGTTTFMNVPAGDYTAVVVALDDDFEMEIGFAAVTVQ